MTCFEPLRRLRWSQVSVKGKRGVGSNRKQRLKPHVETQHTEHKHTLTFIKRDFFFFWLKTPQQSQDRQQYTGTVTHLKGIVCLPLNLSFVYTHTLNYDSHSSALSDEVRRVVE